MGKPLPFLPLMCTHDMPVCVCVCVCVCVTEPYTVREARIHVRHVRDLLKSVGLQDAYASVDCNSLSLLNIITGGNILGQSLTRWLLLLLT